MTDVLNKLVKLLSPKVEGVDQFVGESQDLGWGTVFGGQVLGQALASAASTVTAERAAHSLHGYFLEPGDVEQPVHYAVERLRDGRSFSARRVTARQGATIIFTMTASFQVGQSGFEHSIDAPYALQLLNFRSANALSVSRQSPENFATESRKLPLKPARLLNDPFNQRDAKHDLDESQRYYRVIGVSIEFYRYASDLVFDDRTSTSLCFWLTPGIRMLV